MNKLAVVLGVAAVATLAGCKDPEYARVTRITNDEVKNIETDEQFDDSKFEDVQEEVIHCKCAPGTKHTKPCECGAADCQCIIETKDVAPDYTIYIVQRGDYLAKISKKFNIKIDTIKKLNGMKNDNIRLGQKIKLPGKVEVGEQKMPEGAVKKAPPPKPYQSYKGATVEYVVKAGDTLGGIAYSHGMNIRQLKELNGLKKDTVRIGQKLKVAADGKPAVKTGAVKAPVVNKSTNKPVVAPVPVVDVPPAHNPVISDTETSEPAPVEPPAEEVSVTETVADETPVEPVAVSTAAETEGTTSYVVQEGDNLPRIAIDFEVPVARIRELNNLGEGDEVKPGQVLKIPAAQ